MKEILLNGDGKRVMPRAVYYQCIWMTRDIDRLEELASREKDLQDFSREEIVLLADEREDIISTNLIKEASFRMRCINDALDAIPEEYREGVIEIIKKVRPHYPDTAHENTWNKWKRCYIYTLAKNMRMF